MQVGEEDKGEGSSQEYLSAIEWVPDRSTKKALIEAYREKPSWVGNVFCIQNELLDLEFLLQYCVL